MTLRTIIESHVEKYMKPGKQFTAIILLLLIIFFLSPTHLPAQAIKNNNSSKSFLWEVSSNTATVYLLGSVHYASPDLYPLNPAITNAFNKSDALVVELSPFTLERKNMENIILQRGFYLGSETIRDNITKKAFDMLEDYLNKSHIPLLSVLKMKPGMLSYVLSSHQFKKMGLSPDLGIDVYFANKAQNKKEIIELETIEDHLSLIFDMPNESHFLKYTLLDLEKIDQLYNEIIKAWKHGDVDAINNMILRDYEKHPDLIPILSRIYYIRNMKMAAKIRDLLNTRQTYFVVVGAGHLVGDFGILNLLGQLNYKIRQL